MKLLIESKQYGIYNIQFFCIYGQPYIQKLNKINYFNKLTINIIRLSKTSMNKNSLHHSKILPKPYQKSDSINNTSQLTKNFTLSQITEGEPFHKSKIKLPLYKISSLRLPYENMQKSKSNQIKQNKKSVSQISKSTMSISKQIFTTTIESARPHYLEMNKKKIKKSTKKNSNVKQKKQQLTYPIRIIETLFSVLNSKINTEQNEDISQQKYNYVIDSEQDQPILLIKENKEFNGGQNEQIQYQDNNFSLDYYAIKIQRFWRSYRTKKLIRSHIICNRINTKKEKNCIFSQKHNKIYNLQTNSKLSFFNYCEQTKDTYKPDTSNFVQQSQKPKTFPLLSNPNTQLITTSYQDVNAIPSNQFSQSTQKIYLKPQQMDQLLLDCYDSGNRQILFRSNSQSSDNSYKIPTFVREDNKKKLKNQAKATNLQKVNSQLTKLKFDEIQNIIQKNCQRLQNQFQAQVELLKTNLLQELLTTEEFEIEYKKCNKWLSMKKIELEKYNKQLHKIAGETKLIIKQLNEFEFLPEITLAGSISDPIITYLHNSEQTSFCETDSHDLTNIVQKSLHQKLQQIRQSIETQQQYKELVYQQLLQSMFDTLIKEILEDINKSQPIYQHINKIINNIKYKKAKGIRTDQIVIDSFIKKIIEFAYTKNNNSFSRLNEARGPSSLQILKYSRSHYSIQQNQSFQQMDDESIISFQIFQQFESLVLGMMVFQQEFQNPQIQSQRIKFIKSLINFHNEALFDALNQSLDYQRRYGITGEPFQWNYNKFSSKKKINLEDALQNARARLLRYQSYRCGLNTDKSLNILTNNEDIQIQYVKQHKIIKMIDEVLQDESSIWLRCDMEETSIKLNLVSLMEQDLINQVIGQLMRINNKM